MTSERQLKQIDRYGECIRVASKKWHDYNCALTDRKPTVSLDYYFRSTSGYLTAVRDYVNSLPTDKSGVDLFKALRKSVSGLFANLSELGNGLFGQEILAHFFFEVPAKHFAHMTNSHVSTENLSDISSKFVSDITERFGRIAQQLRDILKTNKRYHEFTTEERTWKNPFFARILKDAANHTLLTLTQHSQELFQLVDPKAGIVAIRNGRTLSISSNARKVWAILRLLLCYSDKYGYVQLPHDWDKAFEIRSWSTTPEAQGIVAIRKLIRPKTTATKSNRGWFRIDLRG